MNLLIRRDRTCIIAMQISNCFLQSEVEMLAHHRFHIFEGPILRVGIVEENGDLICIGIPARDRVIHRSCISSFGILDDLSSDENMIPEQRGKLVARCIAIKWLDSITDIYLVL